MNAEESHEISPHADASELFELPSLEEQQFLLPPEEQLYGILSPSDDSIEIEIALSDDVAPNNFDA
jgi:hypothetical protein